MAAPVEATTPPRIRRARLVETSRLARVTWYGPGRGRPCAVCDQQILRTDVEIECELPGGETIGFHSRLRALARRVAGVAVTGRAPPSRDLAALEVSAVRGGIDPWRRTEAIALRDSQLHVRIVTGEVQTAGHVRWDAGRHVTRAA